MGKKKNVSAPAAAGSSRTTTIDKLKTLNNQLVEEVVEHRKQIQQLRFQIDSLAADDHIRAGIESDIFGLVLSSSLSEVAAHRNAEMAVLMKKADSAAAKLDAAERQLLAVLREKDEIQREIECITEERNSSLRSLEKARKVADSGRKRKKWIYSFVAAAAVVTASVGIATAVAAFRGSTTKN
ncbi:hypothetical protein M5K25_004434 [Dendrobium thyrsiflorum]|uniref:Uncharacterized protein n=1 Tax=Dendrobium thyrsiflorum TaxID=117978 RepID=A0ABD0VUF1_DENTH